MHVAAPDARQGAGQPTIPVELEAFFAVAEKWHLSTEEQITLLGSPGRSTFFKWKKEGGTLEAATRRQAYDTRQHPSIRSNRVSTQ